ncbi:MAG TPA: DUF559 domain-containing protein [Sphingomicrobium sp.]|nr:DUF559 domain-containing protein [Sphingomicrobium sp.]
MPAAERSSIGSKRGARCARRRANELSSQFPPPDFRGRGTSEAGGGASLSTARARSLRRQITPPERRLWRVLKNPPGGFKFRRQHPLEPYFVDFFCHEAAMAVEVDGLAHEMGANPQRDVRRDAWLAGKGIRTLPFRATDIRDNLDGVLTLIVEECLSRTPRKEEGPSTASGGPPPLQMQGRLGEGK